MVDDCLKGLLYCFPANGIIRYGNRIGVFAQQLKRHASLRDERCRHRLQDQLQGRLGSGRSWRCVEKGDGLTRKIRASYQPIQHVLEGPRDSTSILRASDEEAVSLIHSSVQVNDAPGKFVFKIWIEVR